MVRIGRLCFECAPVHETPEVSASERDRLKDEVQHLRETLRDRFAMAALTGLLAHSGQDGFIEDGEDVTVAAWDIADSMMAQR